MSWPLQNAQPNGANWKPKARISPIYGEAMLLSSIARRENALQVDVERDALRRHQVAVRLASAHGAACAPGQDMRNKRRKRRRPLKGIECGRGRSDGYGRPAGYHRVADG